MKTINLKNQRELETALLIATKSGVQVLSSLYGNNTTKEELNTCWVIS
jgi:hypothetical protein